MAPRRSIKDRAIGEDLGWRLHDPVYTAAG